MPLPDSFATARLRAERLTDGHWDVIRALDTDAGHMALLGGPRTEQQSRSYLSWNLEHWDAYGFGLFILRDLAGEAIGRAAIRHLDVEGTDEVELGYGFYPKYWGQGLASEIARELLRLGLEELRLRTMVAITRPTNIGSQRVLIRTGLVYQRDIAHDGVVHQLYRSI